MLIFIQRIIAAGFALASLYFHNYDYLLISILIWFESNFTVIGRELDKLKKEGR